MSNKNLFTRRDLLRLMGVFGTAYLVRSCAPIGTRIFQEGMTDPAKESNLDIDLVLKAVPARVQIHEGDQTLVWRYQGEVISGPADTLVEIPGSYLGPAIHVWKGQRVRISFQNELPEPSIIHWHGLHVPPIADGHPRLVIDPGETYTYEFTVLDRAGTYWYHPHPHGRTGPQVYAGLAGLFIIHDQVETELQLPVGEFDIPLVIQDRTLDDGNQLVYGTGHMMDRMVGFLGDKIFVNGRPLQTERMASRPYRVRLLNGSNSRIYKIGRDDGKPLIVLGTDGGLLDRPLTQSAVTLAPAQRIELWLDFGNLKEGEELKLINLPFEGFGGESSYPIARFKAGPEIAGPTQPPNNLPSLETYLESDAINRLKPRKFQLGMGRGMAWTLNGRTFELEDVARNEVVNLDELEIWEFENLSGMGMGMMSGMELPHPMHLHGLQFQIVERKMEGSSGKDWQSLGEGLVDAGWHDTVLVRPREKVRILVKFKDFTGLYLYHCHNLEHEDMGMMRNYKVV